MVLARLKLFLGMIRFSHTIFALPFALLSALLAWHSKERFQWIELAGIILCMIFGRSTAMAFNRIADRRLDADNPRTAGRHLPAGQLSVFAVSVFTMLCVIGFVASTLVFLWAEPSNPWPLYLSLPVLGFICLYSLTKRFTALAHFWLGASLLLAPVAAWIAIRGMEDLLVPSVIGLAVMFWVAGFDIIYACQDVDHDRWAGLHSIPAKLGIPGALRVALLCHILMIISLLTLSSLAPVLGTVYLMGVAAVAVLLVYEHYLVTPNDLTRVNQAFFNVNAVVSLGLFLVVLVQIVVAR